MESKKKSPYELDLEVMDRKPDIPPKVGDWVKIKSKEWYEKWKDSYGSVNVHRCFIDKMQVCCGRIYRIAEVTCTNRFILEDERYAWSMEMFEQVYPQEEYTVHKTYFGDIVTPISKGPTAMEAIHSKEGRISSHILPKDGTLLGCDYQQMLNNAVSSYMPSIKDLTDPCTITSKVNGDFVSPYPPKQSMQAYIKPETKLRIINTNQLIKIEKL